MPDVESQPSPTLRSLLGSLTVVQAWAIGGAIVSIVVSCFLVGVFAESVKNAAEVDRLSNRNTDLQRSVNDLTSTLKSVLNERRMIEGKAEFLNRYVSYLVGHDDISKQLLVNVVCTLWKDSETRRIRIDGQRLISPADINGEMSPDVRDLLIRYGVSPDLLSRIRQNNVQRFAQAQPFARVNRPFQIQRQVALAEVEKQTSNIRVVKIITFYDGSAYQMPQEIAVAVHTKSECSLVHP
jgi:hypothetical protein